MRYKAVLFDLDGTIITTEEEFIVGIMGKALAHFDIPVTEELCKRLWYGDNRSEVIEEELGKNPKEFWEYFNSIHSVEERAKHVDIYTPNDGRIIAHLKYRLGIKTGIVSSTTQECLDMELELLGRHLFDHTISADGISKAECIEECLKRFKRKPGKSLYLGNSDGDIIEAAKAGVDSAIIDRNEYPITLKPKHKINELKELISILDN